MSEDRLTIENTPQLFMFMRLWMASGAMVLNTVEGLVKASEDRMIELPDLAGRDVGDELTRLQASFATILERVA